ncbi:MAG TPA: tetratricopeptide repeat protein [Pyrinomonadaceae bacterium]
MNVRSLQLIALCFCLSALSGSAQTPATPAQPTQPPQPRSHVERFSSPQARATQAEAEATARLKTNPNDAETLNARAYARMGLGRYAEAVEDLRRAVSLNQKRADYYANLGYALWKTGRYIDGINAERAALKLDDKNFTAHYQLGRFLLLSADLKQLPEAATHLRRALELDPRRSEIRFDLLTVYRTLGDQPNAIAQLNLLQDARPADPRVTYADALLASDRGDLNAAVNGFREALRLDPTLYGAWQDLGLAFIKLKRWPDAVETFAELTRRQSDSVEAAYFYALSLFNAGQVRLAEREARRTLRLDAGAAAAHTLLGIILASRGGADAESSEALSQAIALDPTSFDAHFYLGRVQYAMSDFAPAVKSLRAAVKLNPKHAEARFFLGTALESAGESEAALAEYQKLVEIDPQSPIGQVGLGALQVKQGRIEEAIATLKHAVALDPKIFEAHWALGRALALNERFPEAIESLKTAVALLPDRADAHYQLGLALRRAGRAEEAKNEFAIVERLNNEFRARTR